MYTEKQLVKLSLFAERAHRLALDMALAAAELAEHGQGMAFVADETRNFGMKLQLFLDKDAVTEDEICDATLQIRFLAVNGCLEMLRLSKSNRQVKKKLAVIFDEIRNIAHEVEDAFNLKQDEPLILPRVSEKNTIVDDSTLLGSDLRFVLFEIGGKQFCETTTNVQEIYLYPASQLAGNTVTIRGQELTLINCYNKLSLQAPEKEFFTILCVTAGYQKASKQYALVIDGVPDIFFTSIGKNTLPKDILGDFVRECWNCEEEKQMMFLAYEALCG